MADDVKVWASPPMPDMAPVRDGIKQTMAEKRREAEASGYEVVVSAIKDVGSDDAGRPFVYGLVAWTTPDVAARLRVAGAERG